MSATTEDDYVRTAAGWRLQRYRFLLMFLTPFDEPWSKSRGAMFGR